MFEDMNRVELFLILKYGGMEDAFKAWMHGSPVTYDEYKLLLEYGATNHPGAPQSIGPNGR